MKLINKDQVHELVELFYQNPFKTFYVNSVDGKSFVKPTGVFVSLGITTSLKSLENIKDILNNYDGYSAKIVEIKSTKVSSQYLNIISKTDDICQYDMDTIPERCFDRDQALRYFPDSEVEENKWKSLFNKIDESEDSWNNKLLQEDPETGEIRIFHKKVNYKKDPDSTEYRIGIYVTED